MCALCNRGMEMRMLQGKLTRYDPTPEFNPFELHNERIQSQKEKEPNIVHEEPPVIVRRGPGKPPGKGRKKGTVVIGFPIFNTNPNLPLDMILFGTTKEREIDELFESTGQTWCHTCCAVWSEGVQQEEMCVRYVDKTVVQAMSQVQYCFHSKVNGFITLDVVCTITFAWNN